MAALAEQHGVVECLKMLDGFAKDACVQQLAAMNMQGYLDTAIMVHLGTLTVSAR